MKSQITSDKLNRMSKFSQNSLKQAYAEVGNWRAVRVIEDYQAAQEKLQSLSSDQKQR